MSEEEKDLNQLAREEKDLKKFLSICKKEWGRIHNSERKRKGRPSQKDYIWEACSRAVSQGRLHPPFTQNKVIGKIKDDIGIISEKTLLTHVKAWIADQIWITALSETSKGQLYWLLKNDPDLLRFIEKFLSDMEKCQEILSTLASTSDKEKRQEILSTLASTSDKFYKEFIEHLQEKWKDVGKSLASISDEFYKADREHLQKK